MSVYKVPEAARYLGMSTSTLNKWRMFGNGPPFMKMGSSVLYRKEDLDSWMESRVRESTSDRPP